MNGPKTNFILGLWKPKFRRNGHFYLPFCRRQILGFFVSPATFLFVSRWQKTLNQHRLGNCMFKFGNCWIYGNHDCCHHFWKNLPTRFITPKDIFGPFWMFPIYWTSSSVIIGKIRKRCYNIISQKIFWYDFCLWNSNSIFSGNKVMNRNF